MDSRRILAALALLCAALLTAACGKAPAPAPTPTPEPVVFASGASYPAGAERIETPLAPGETELLKRFDRLQTAEVSGSADYAELAAYAAAHPELSLIHI